MNKVDKICKLREWCDKQDIRCNDCMFSADEEKSWCSLDVDWGATCPDEILDDALNRIGVVEEEPTPVTEENTSVNHPSHYNQEGAMECIDEMILFFGREAVMHFCMCNAWKYRYRANAKNGKEDMDKANWYIKKYKELSESVF